MLAQLVERHPCNVNVVGSNPSHGSRNMVHWSSGDDTSLSMMYTNTRGSSPLCTAKVEIIITMHKIRNTKHIEVLNSLIGTTPFGCMNPLSKKMLWKLCILHNWDRKKVLKDIKDDTYWVHFYND